MSARKKLAKFVAWSAMAEAEYKDLEEAEDFKKAVREEAEKERNEKQKESHLE